jgi:hypothetical protein
MPASLLKRVKLTRYYKYLRNGETRGYARGFLKRVKLTSLKLTNTPSNTLEAYLQANEIINVLYDSSYSVQ